ncbi:MAG: hypothetical protein KDC32_14695 [Saprospiraceae bacterium]|nr:hypothetical protein [Saprospiraceae bacterium]
MDRYLIIDGEKYDRRLMEKVQELLEINEDGCLYQEDAEALATFMFQGGRLTPVERKTLEYLYTRYEWVDDSRSWLQAQVPPSGDADLGDLVDRIVWEEYELPEMEVDISEEEVDAQNDLPDNRVTLDLALREALDSFLYDDRHPESPRRIIKDIFRLRPESGSDGEARLLQKIRELANEGVLSLLPLTPDPDYDLPPRGESADTRWLFGLSLPELPDHYFWAMVDRKGEEETYNYGANVG